MNKLSKSKINNEDTKSEDSDNSNIQEFMNTNDITLINNSFEYFDKNNDKYKDKFIDVMYINLERNDNDLDHSILHFYNKNLKLLFSYKFERLGIYDTKSQIWSWAWTIPYFKKNETNIIRKILHYGTELDNTSIFLKTELITSRFRITNNCQLDMHCAIASYLSKKSLIYKFRIFSNPEIIEDKFFNILYPKYTYEKDMDEIYEITYYVFLLEEIVKS
jgi:hypothetical protein